MQWVRLRSGGSLGGRIVSGPRPHQQRAGSAGVWPPARVQVQQSRRSSGDDLRFGRSRQRARPGCNQRAPTGARTWVAQQASQPVSAGKFGEHTGQPRLRVPLPSSHRPDPSVTLVRLVRTRILNRCDILRADPRRSPRFLWAARRSRFGRRAPAGAETRGRRARGRVTHARRSDRPHRCAVPELDRTDAPAGAPWTQVASSQRELVAARGDEALAGPVRRPDGVAASAQVRICTPRRPHLTSHVRSTRRRFAGPAADTPSPAPSGTRT